MFEDGASIEMLAPMARAGLERFCQPRLQVEHPTGGHRGADLGAELDALKVLALANGPGAELFCQGASELEREHEPDVARRRPGLRAPRDGNLGRLLGLNTTASLRRWRQGKFGLVASRSPGSRTSPSTHVEVPVGSASGIAQETARAPAPWLCIMAAGRRRKD